MKNQSSLPKIIKNLWEENFFSEAKNFSQIEKALGNKGCHPPTNSLSVALIRCSMSGGFLVSKKEKDERLFIQRNAPIYLETNSNIFDGYSIHPRINEVSFKQFKNGHFKEAVQNALVEVIDQVKIKTNYPKDKNGHDLDGDDLMNQVFAIDGKQFPVIKFNDLKNSLDKAEQRGIYYLYKGIVGIRDKKAHLNFIQNDSLKTLEYLFLASLLIRLLDNPQ